MDKRKNDPKYKQWLTKCGTEKYPIPSNVSNKEINKNVISRLFLIADN
jgi:hypothetical protein